MLVAQFLQCQVLLSKLSLTNKNCHIYQVLLCYHQGKLFRGVTRLTLSWTNLYRPPRLTDKNHFLLFYMKHDISNYLSTRIFFPITWNPRGIYFAAFVARVISTRFCSCRTDGACAERYKQCGPRWPTTWTTTSDIGTFHWSLDWNTKTKSKNTRNCGREIEPKAPPPDLDLADAGNYVGKRRGPVSIDSTPE